LVIAALGIVDLRFKIAR